MKITNMEQFRKDYFIENAQKVIDTNKLFEKNLESALKARIEARTKREIDIPFSEVYEQVKANTPRYTFIKDVEIDGERVELTVDFLDRKIMR